MKAVVLAQHGRGRRAVSELLLSECSKGSVEKDEWQRAPRGPLSQEQRYVKNNDQAEGHYLTLGTGPSSLRSTCSFVIASDSGSHTIPTLLFYSIY